MPGKLKSRNRNINWALAWAKAYLNDRGIKDPYLDAQVLLAHCLGMDIVGLYREGERQLSLQESDAFCKLVQRRGKNEPVAYLTGRKEFMGLVFEVSRDVLIPRPETELLVEKALELYSRYWPGKPLIFADIGTGCGNIAVSLARELPLSKIYAVDISPCALKIAEKNAGVHGVREKMIFSRGDLLAPLDGLGLEGKINLITANLPYIKTSGISSLMPDVGLYEPREALDGGPDGLDLYRRLIPWSLCYLTQPGFLLMEIDPEQGREIASYLSISRWKFECLSDLAGRDRLVIACP
ncbi:MAG: Release factor glutamine methyltransferase [Desulfotomaculum sp. 46_296]|nr:MAG: Release factor glutamine methyltransferase [Desulfotomaculum sp. 46_296]HAU32712.1 peptide chain release factor N(5)-glutamine methyltransferase [Desulfotomaculum sp.]